MSNVTCPHCNRLLQSNRWPGGNIRCGQCGGVFEIPEIPDEPEITLGLTDPIESDKVDFVDHIGDGGMELRAINEEIKILRATRKKIGFRDWCTRHVPGSDAISLNPVLFYTMITLAFAITAGAGAALIVGKWGHPGGIVFGTLLLCPPATLCVWYLFSASQEEREINRDLNGKLEEFEEQVSLLKKWRRKQALELKRKHKLLAREQKSDREARYARETRQAEGKSSEGFFRTFGMLHILVTKKTKRIHNGCADCSNTWYPRGADMAAKCPRCGSRNVVLCPEAALVGVCMFVFYVVLGGFIVGSMITRPPHNPQEMESEKEGHQIRDEALQGVDQQQIAKQQGEEWERLEMEKQQMEIARQEKETAKKEREGQEALEKIRKERERLENLSEADMKEIRTLLKGSPAETALGLKTVIRLGSNGEEALPEVLELVDGERTRRQALKALEAIGPASIPGLVEIMKKQTAGEKMEIATLLISIDKRDNRVTDAVVPVLVAALRPKDTNEPVCRPVIELIQTVGKPCVKAIFKALAEADDRGGVNANNRKFLFMALEKLGAEAYSEENVERVRQYKQKEKFVDVQAAATKAILAMSSR